MNVIDLSHPLSEATPVYPGAEPPEIIEACTLARHGFAEKRLRLYTHTGTHLDVPAHLLAGGATVDVLRADRFIGAGCVLDVSGSGRRDIEIADLEKERARIANAEFILFHTGWAERWGAASYFDGYPVLSAEAARWLAGFDLKGVGVDAISFDVMNSTDVPVHKTFLGKNIILVENLRGLDALAGREFVFVCLPLNIAGGDGSPVRAAAII